MAILSFHSGEDRQGEEGVPGRLRATARTKRLPKKSFARRRPSAAPTLAPGPRSCGGRGGGYNPPVSFASSAFWLFCLAALGLFWATPCRYRWVTLLGVSYAFYGSFGLEILAVLVLLTAAVYLVSRAMARADGTRRRILLAVDIGVPLAALVVFKYLELFWQALLFMAGPFANARPAEPFNLLVPVGISFYVFKLISYAVEVYPAGSPSRSTRGISRSTSRSFRRSSPDRSRGRGS